jgi:redox-sensitive bicupin YhaK (pirin superfamily)
MWDLRLGGGASLKLDLPEGRTSVLVVLAGRITVGGSQAAGEAEMILLSREGEGMTINADGDATVLVLTGEPIDEPVVGYGPFVMNSEIEIGKAFDDFESGRLG